MDEIEMDEIEIDVFDKYDKITQGRKDYQSVQNQITFKLENQARKLLDVIIAAAIRLPDKCVMRDSPAVGDILPSERQMTFVWNTNPEIVLEINSSDVVYFSYHSCTISCKLSEVSSNMPAILASLGGVLARSE